MASNTTSTNVILLCFTDCSLMASALDGFCAIRRGLSELLGPGGGSTISDQQIVKLQQILGFGTEAVESVLQSLVEKLFQEEVTEEGFVVLEGEAEVRVAALSENDNEGSYIECCIEGFTSKSCPVDDRPAQG